MLVKNVIDRSDMSQCDNSAQFVYDNNDNNNKKKEIIKKNNNNNNKIQIKEEE